MIVSTIPLAMKWLEETQVQFVVGRQASLRKYLSGRPLESRWDITVREDPVVS